MAGARLELVDVLDGAQVDGVHGKAVESVGRQSDDLAALQRIDHVGDEVWLGLVRMNTKNFGVQRESSPSGEGIACRRG